MMEDWTVRGADGHAGVYHYGARAIGAGAGMNDEEPELRPMSAWEFWGTLTLIAVVLGCASALKWFA